MKTKKKAGKTIAAIVGTLLIFLGSLAHYSAKWYISTYGDVGFDSILFTLFGGLGNQ